MPKLRVHWCQKRLIKWLLTKPIERILKELCTMLCFLPSQNSYCLIPSLHLGSLKWSEVWACPLLVSPPLLRSSNAQTNPRAAQEVSRPSTSSCSPTACSSAMSAGWTPAGSLISPTLQKFLLRGSHRGADACKGGVGRMPVRGGAAGPQPGSMSSSSMLVCLASFHLSLLFLLLLFSSSFLLFASFIYNLPIFFFTSYSLTLLSFIPSFLLSFP